MNEEDKSKLLAQIHKGLPNATVDIRDVLNITLEGVQPGGEAGAEPEMADAESMRISLEAVDVNIHNQSFGIISASTGCISNPGGPSC